MVRNSLSRRDGNHSAYNVAGNGGISFHSVRDRLRLKRNPSDRRDRSHSGLDRSHSGLDWSHSGLDRSHSGLDRSHSGLDRSHSGLDRSHSGLDRSSLRSRPHHIGRSLNRKSLLSLLNPRGTCLLYILVSFTVCAFVMSSLLPQNSITWQGNAKGAQARSRIGLGSTLKYVPGGIARTSIEGEGIDPLRSTVRIGVRPPRLALVSFLFQIDA